MSITTQTGADGRTYHMCETSDDYATLLANTDSPETAFITVQREVMPDRDEAVNFIVAEYQFTGRDGDTVDNVMTQLIENHPFQPQGWN